MKILSIQQMRKLEELAFSQGIVPSALMETAGENAAHAIMQCVANLPDTTKLRFVCIAGKGNNGGDAWVVARTLQKQGFNAIVYSTAYPDTLDTNAATYAPQLKADTVTFLGNDGNLLPTRIFSPGDIIVDGLLGIGAQGAPRGMVLALINAINQSNLPIFSLDTPSGLNADTGDTANTVHADWTLTMGLPKSGLLAETAQEAVGRLRVVDIGISHLEDQLPSTAQGAISLQAFGLRDARASLQKRPILCHKNSVGRVCCICNSSRYSGAGFLCAEAALRTGAGYATLVTPAGAAIHPAPHALVMRQVGSADCPAFTEDAVQSLPAILANHTAIACGPGIGPDASHALLECVLKSEIPLVLDADALRLLARFPECIKLQTAPVILTPHPGEMLALADAFGIQNNHLTRPEQTLALAHATHCTVVLKGHHTCIAAPNSNTVSINLSGDNALATAGTGDVLTGIIATLLAGGITHFHAACLGTFIHGLAGDIRKDISPRGLIADDLIKNLPRAWSIISPFA